MQRLHLQPRAPERQPDLFLSDYPAIPDAAHAWDALPDRTRQALTGLLAHLFMAHAGNSAPATGGDADER